MRSGLEGVPKSVQHFHRDSHRLWVEGRGEGRLSLVGLTVEGDHETTALFCQNDRLASPVAGVVLARDETKLLQARNKPRDSSGIDAHFPCQGRNRGAAIRESKFAQHLELGSGQPCLDGQSPQELTVGQEHLPQEMEVVGAWRVLKQSGVESLVHSFDDMPILDKVNDNINNIAGCPRRPSPPVISVCAIITVWP
jgi:hypothetical protein